MDHDKGLKPPCLDSQPKGLKHLAHGPVRHFRLVTFVTHNSRVSERMITLGVQAGPALIFSAKEQLVVAQTLANAWRKHDIPVVACNVLPDHVHMVMAAVDESELNRYVHKIKGGSSHTLRQVHGWQSDSHIWQQKFNRHLLASSEALYNGLNYVLQNHLKHLDRWGEDALGMHQGKGLQPLMDPVTLFMERDKGLKPLASDASIRDRILHALISASVPFEIAASFEP